MNEKKSKLPVDFGTKQEQGQNILFDYSEISTSLWLLSAYFQDSFHNTFGKKTTKTIFKALSRGYISSKQYDRLISHCSDGEIKKLIRSLDREKLNKSQGIERELSDEDLLELGDEMQIEIDQIIMRYRIFDDILDTSLYDSGYEVINDCDDFKIIMNKQTELFYLDLNGVLFTKHHVFGSVSNGDITVSQLLFNGDSETYIYDLSTNKLSIIDGEFKFAYNILGIDYALIESQKSGSTIYGIQNGVEFQKIANVIDMVQHGDDILIIYSYGERSESKVGKNKTRIDSYVGVYSIVNGQTVHEYVGAHIEPEGVIKSPVGFALNIHEKNPYTNVYNSIMREQSTLYYIDSDVTPDNLGEVKAKLKFGRNTKFDTYQTRNDIIVISKHEINLDNGKHTDIKPYIYNIHSLSGSFNRSKILSIKEITLSNGILEIYYQDSKGEQGYFNSEYSYKCVPMTQPKVITKHLN